MLKNDHMPAPETMVEYFSGECGAAMFHYAGERDNVENIARNHGFDIQFLKLEHDDSPGAEELNTAYENGASDICARWNPPAPEGWQLALKGDTEDGPFVAFIRKRAS